MELSVSHMFIHNAQFLGVMKSAIIKEFHDIKLRIDFYKILANDRQVIEIIKNNCEKDHTNVDTLKLVSTDLIYTKVMNYTEAENFIIYLRFIHNRNIQEDMKNGQHWIIDFKFSTDVNFFKIVMNSLQVLRLYTQVNAFYSNYLTLSSITRYHILSERSTEKFGSEKKVTEYIPSTNNVQNRQETPIEPEVKVDLVRERNELDDIFELCLSSSIKSSLIHYTFNYFKYITDKNVKILTNNGGQVQYTLPILMPKSINEQYFTSLILSNASIPLNNVTYVVKKILNNLINNCDKYRENALLPMMLGYLLLVYLLRCLHDSNKESFRAYFKYFISNPYAQNQLFTKMIETGFKEFAAKLYFKITDIDLTNVSDEYNLERIATLSDQYKHLIPVSQEEFAAAIFKKFQGEDAELKKPSDFKLSCKKVIDVARIMNDSQKLVKPAQSILFDPDNTLSPVPELENEYNFLDYKLQSNNGNKIITKAYQQLLNYVKNPSSILITPKNEVPKEVQNLFETLSKKVLNLSKIKKDDVSTYSYYKILLENLPHPEKFKHTTLLYIIFQIIIPYHYDVYNNSQFEDVFL